MTAEWQYAIETTKCSKQHAPMRRTLILTKVACSSCLVPVTCSTCTCLSSRVSLFNSRAWRQMSPSLLVTSSPPATNFRWFNGDSARTRRNIRYVFCVDVAVVSVMFTKKLKHALPSMLLASLVGWQVGHPVCLKNNHITSPQTFFLDDDLWFISGQVGKKRN